MKPEKIFSFNFTFNIFICFLVVLAVGVLIYPITHHSARGIIMTDQGGAKIKCENFDRTDCGASFTGCEDGVSYYCMTNVTIQAVK